MNSSADYDELIDDLYTLDADTVCQADKEARLLPLLNRLHHMHQQHCDAYSNIVKANGECHSMAKMSDLPYLSVNLFKQLRLSSIASEQVFRVLQSSGTTGNARAQIALDQATSRRQSTALIKILQGAIGKQRRPMLVVDCPSTVNAKSHFNARSAGVMGLMPFASRTCFALDENMQLNLAAVQEFAEKYAGQPVLIFGFTFMVWRYFIQALEARGITFDFDQAVLIHSGGWKKLEQEKVSNDVFKRKCAETLHLSRVHNFYGMAEQVGSIFVECAHGVLHAPAMADVIVRDPYTLVEADIGQPGVIQVLSALPTSYPGFSLLTEDMGTVQGVDDCPCGRKGKYFSVTGRLPKTEVRGCSDTHQETSA